MGTLGDQSPRNAFRRDLLDFIEELQDVAKKSKLTIDQVIAAKRALELERQNNLAVQNGDFFDEQIAGIGDRLREIASATEAANS